MRARTREGRNPPAHFLISHSLVSTPKDDFGVKGKPAPPESEGAGTGRGYATVRPTSGRQKMEMVYPAMNSFMPSNIPSHPKLQVMALYDYQAVTETELSFHAGDIITILVSKIIPSNAAV